MGSTAYSRHFLRIRPDTPVYGEIRIVHIGGKDVCSNKARVRLLDMGIGGVRFVSVLKLPVDNKVVLELTIEFDGIKYRCEGHIVSSYNVEVHEYEYGLCFLQPEIKLRKALLKIFSKMSEKQDNYIIFRMSGRKSN